MSDPAPETDREGYLVYLEDWTPRVAEQLAEREQITLTPAHWEIVELLRLFYAEYEHAPAMRPLVKFIKQHLGNEKGNSLHLLALFPSSPAKLAAKIAGLPKPANCL